MKNILLLLPLYNDWKSLNHLLSKINKQFKKKKLILNIVIVNDNSTEHTYIEKNKFKYLNKIRIINLKRNFGSQKAIFFGLKKIVNKIPKSIIIIMDSDGEDDQSKIKTLISCVRKNPNSVIFAKRSKRLENPFLRILNFFRLILTYILTGKYLDIGNFSAFCSIHLKKILKNNDLSLAFCSGVLKNFKKIQTVSIEKKKRYFGASRVNFLFLIKHSVNIISVFYKIVFFRIFMIFLLIFIFFPKVKILIFLIAFFLSMNFTFLFFYLFNISRKNTSDNIKNVKKIK